MYNTTLISQIIVTLNQNVVMEKDEIRFSDARKCALPMSKSGTLYTGAIFCINPVEVSR
jgi:hypothetical protein